MRSLYAGILLLDKTMGMQPSDKELPPTPPPDTIPPEDEEQPSDDNGPAGDEGLQPEDNNNNGDVDVDEDVGGDGEVFFVFVDGDNNYYLPTLLAWQKCCLLYKHTNYTS
jgi:hypothetical protein